MYVMYPYIKRDLIIIEAMKQTEALTVSKMIKYLKICSKASTEYSNPLLDMKKKQFDALLKEETTCVE